MDQAEVSISVVSGREEADLKGFLTSLPNAAKKVTVKVFVIDNQASFSVDSVVQSTCPKAHIIHNNSLKGYGANHNQVLKHLETEFALIANDDIELGSSCIDQLVDFAVSNPDVGLVVPTLHLRNWQTPPMLGGGKRKRRIPVPLTVCLYMFLLELGGGSFLDRFYSRRFKQLRRRHDIVELAYATGACCLIRRDVIQKIGVFDEDFYMYLEDIDFGFRAREAGFRCVQLLQAKALHIGERTVGSRSWRYMRSSLPCFTRKHHGVVLRSLVQFFVRLIDVIRVIKGSDRVE